MENRHLREVIGQFHISGTPEKITPHGSGHIHDTFRVFNEISDSPDYLLQRINSDVFKNVPAVMSNIERVLDHLQRKTPDATHLTLVPTSGGASYFQDVDGGYWRVYVFLKGLTSHYIAKTPEQVYEGARAFGGFLANLSDFPADSLHETILAFHHLPTRLKNFEQSVREDTKGRMQEAQEWIAFVRERADEMCKIQKLGDAGAIPLRVTHNDTKFDNVLMDKGDKAKCVIDLDTVMPGYVHFDFGDGMRTSVSSAAEDEADLANIQIDLERFQAFADGYLSAAGETLTEIEIQKLAFSGAMMTFMIGVRFLTDFLDGDVYYKTQFPGQNLRRAKAQLELARKILQRLPDLEKVM